MLDDLLHIFYPRTYTLSNGKKVKEKFNIAPYAVIVIVIFSIVCGIVTNCDFGYMFSRTKQFWDLVRNMFPPNWSYLPDLFKPMVDTVVMSLLGTAIGCLIALPVSFYLSANFKLNKAYLVTHRGLLSILRTLPTMVYAQLLSIVIGTGTLAGTIAIAIFTYTISVKMLYEQIETVDMGPYEDYHDLINRNVITCSSYAQYMFDRIDRASLAAGLAPRISQLNENIRKQVAEKLEDLAKKMTLEKQQQYTDDLDGKTIIIENSRGGKDGSSMPLTGTQGYQYSLPNYCPEILENAAILYIWVTPEESRRKNIARCNPDDPGSNLNHMTPASVMMYDYGCDDMIYLKEISEKPDTVTVNSHGKKYYVPIAIIDNRVDLTTMFRATPDKWDKEAVENFTKVTRTATDTMWKNYK